MDKIPVAPFDRSHDANGINSQRSLWWVDVDTAIAQAAALGPEYGVAFVITENDPFFLFDIDNCAQAGGWSPLALEILGELAGAAVEVSQSGNGLHILGTCQPFDHGCKNDALGLEVYTSGRFVALTGRNAGGDITTDCSATLPALTHRLIGEGTKIALDDWTSEPRDGWMGYTDDADLIERACNSTSVGSAFGQAKASFAQLWQGDADALAEVYPDDEREYNASQADAALAQHLAFWTGCDCDRIERLMRQSGLMRDKWDNHNSYLQRTILKAVALQGDVHQLKRLAPEPVAPTATLGSNSAEAPTVYQPELVSGFQYLAVDQQLEHFKGCVYVQHSNQILTPDGMMLKPDQFKATYGGYLFALDANQDKQTKNAWEAFVESQAIRHVKVHRAWFRPDQPFGHITEHDGARWVNTYKPIPIPCHPGDVSPFLNHLNILLPVQSDRDIVLAYMAAVVQHKGSKFQWAPLIQGAEGNGKTLFSRCLEFAVGERYSHMPRADEIGEKFNDWLFDKIFIGVEDIYVAENKRELIEVLKPMITNTRLAERAMQSGQVMKPLCANFLFNSNHKDAVRKTRNDRRFAVFYCAQQSEADVVRDGLTGDYFPKLYDWLRNGGYAAIHHYLATYDIPAELNPAVDCGGLSARAPYTSSTDEAVEASLGRVEQEVMEAIDEQRPGFAGGWVSSTALDRLLDERRAADKIPRNKRKDMMLQLGYDYHPALSHNNGRATTPTQTDGNKPRLFIKNGHLSRNIETAADAVHAYDKAQNQAAGSSDPAIAGAFGKN